jgi:U2 small nuclear ribonucleoprotein B''
VREGGERVVMNTNPTDASTVSSGREEKKAGMEAKQTLYVSNLNTRLNKKLLKQHLYHLFGIYGQIIDIVALKTPRMRGQAFVVYKEVRMALAAMQALQNFEFHHKPLMIAFAKTRSNKAIEWDKYVMGPAREMARKQAMEMTGRRQAMEQTFGQNIMPAHMLHPHAQPQPFYAPSTIPSKRSNQ